MAIQRHFQAKFYDQDNSTFLKVYSTQRPEGATRGYLKNSPAFTSNIDGGFGECVLDLSLHFHDFDEGTSVDFMNIVKIYAVRVDNGAQDVELIYTGFISRYEPYYEGGDEGVRVTLLGLVSLLSFSHFKNGTSFTYARGAEDPTVTGKAIIDHFNTIYGGSLLSYDATSVPSTLGTNITYTFTDTLWADALRKVAELAGTGWWWKVDETGKYWLLAKPGSATHVFTIGKDIESLVLTKDSEKVVNDVQVRHTGGTASDYSDATSQSTFGTGSPASGKRTKIVSDTAIQNSTTADQRGNKEINDGKDEKVSARITINTAYDLESIKVGETCSVRNLQSASVIPDNLQIVSLSYNGDSVSMELERTTTNFGRELAEFVS